jgi:hypothetical protein
MLCHLIRKSIYRIVFLSFLVVSLDIFTTFLGLFHFGLYERNDVVRYLVVVYGVYGLLLWYPVEFFAVAAVMLFLFRLRTWLGVRILPYEYVPFFIMVYVVVNNSLLILSVNL